MAKNKEHSGEFEWIGGIRDRFAPLLSGDLEGIGDDGAVIPAGERESWVLTTDMLVENVHFIPDEIAPEDLGYKSLAVNLSDVAAMGARPVGSFLSIGIPARLSEKWRNRFLDGYQRLSERFNVPLLGGDTTRAENLVINVTAIGKVLPENVKRRSGAKPGDLICVTGNLGDSGAGLRLLPDKKKRTAQEEELVKAHYLPKPYVDEGMWLGAQRAVHAMMDVSDGIASDLAHILKASGVGGLVNLSALPVSDNLRGVSVRRKWSAEELAASAGEDYVLLFTAAQNGFDRLSRDYKDRFHSDLTVIGEIQRGAAWITWVRDGEPVEVNWKGFSHF